MFKMLMLTGFAALMLTPEMTRALQTEQAESATLAQITAATSPAALQAPGADGRLTELAHHLLALVGGGDATTPQKAAPQALQWVPIGDYMVAMAQTQPQQAAP